MMPLCPFTQKECIKAKCAWYVDRLQRCVLNALIDILEDLEGDLEDISLFLERKRFGE